MDSMADITPQNQRIVSLSSKQIPAVDIIKTLEDTILGTVLLGKFSYEGERETNYTYIKRLEIGLDQSKFWSLVATSKKHPEKGYIPKLLAYSLHSEYLIGYLDGHSDQVELRKQMLGNEGDDFVNSLSTAKIRELYFEPFPENLRIALQKRAKDKIPYTEDELLLFITSMLQTLKSFEDHGIRHGNLSPDCIIPASGRFWIYHPTLIPDSVNPYLRVQSLAKHYTAPEVVDLILECNSPQEFNLIVDDIDWYKADLFSAGLIALELASLVEEDDWYNEDMIIRKDLLEVKMNLVRNQYSLRLSRLLEALLSPYQARPSVDGMLKLAIPKSDSVGHFQRLLEKHLQIAQTESEAQGHVEVLSPQFESDKENSSKNGRIEKDVSDVDSREAKKIEVIGQRTVDRDARSEDLPQAKNDSPTKKEFSPVTFPHKQEKDQEKGYSRSLKAEEIKPFDSMLFSSNLNPVHETSPKQQGPLKHEALSVLKMQAENSSKLPTTSHQQWQPAQQANTNQTVRLPQMQSIGMPVFGQPHIEVVHSRDPSPVIKTTRVFYKTYDPVEISRTPLGIEKHIDYSPREARPTGKCTVREDRSKSPKLVSVKKYIIKDGQKILISEEKFPGYDDGFRGYIDLRGKTPEKIENPSAQKNEMERQIRQEAQYLAAPAVINSQYHQVSPQISNIKKSLEPIFGTESMYKSAAGASNFGKQTGMTNSKIHSLAALQRSSHQDFSKVAEEIKTKLDELITKERAREEREKTLAEEYSKSKSRKDNKRFSPLENTPYTKDNQSSKTLSNIKLDLNNVECCKDCKQLRKDKSTHLYKCLNHPKSPRYVEVAPSKSSRSITPERKPVSIERKLVFHHGDLHHETNPRGGFPSTRMNEQPKKLVPLVHETKGFDLVTPEQIRKFRESMAKNKLLKKKAENIASDVLNFELQKKEKEKEKGSNKPSTKREKNKEKDVWKKLQLNGEK
jgi:SLT domain-containing protein